MKEDGDEAVLYNYYNACGARLIYVDLGMRLLNLK